MSDFIYMALHFAITYLHTLLAWRFYPQRQNNFIVYVFWLLMLLSIWLHISYATGYLFFILDYHVLKSYMIFSAHAGSAFLPALLATLFLSELTTKPKKSNLLQKGLSLISFNSRYLFSFCIFISLVTLTFSIRDTFLQPTPQYVVGNMYSVLFMICFAVIWLFMWLFGLRPSSDKNIIIKPIFRIIMVALIILFIAGHVLNFGEYSSLLPIVFTVGISLCFCWSRFRTQFMDVIINQFIFLLIVIFSTLGFVWIFQYTLQLTYEAKKVAVFAFILALVIAYKVLGKKLSSFWHPPIDKLSLIHSDLPSLLAECHHSEAAISTTEQFLCNLFNSKIVINQKLNDPVHHLHLEGSPAVTIQLGYLRNWLPWFSEALHWVRTAGLHLQRHLKLLQSLELDHQQQLKTESLISLAAKAELNAMRAQIRPHFLFNTLNSIHCFVTTEPELAESTIEILSDIMRSVLVMSEKDEVLLHTELDIAEKYLQIEKIRYGEQFEYRIEVAPECNGLMIPPFSVQPLVENAIKHAVDSQFEPVDIQVNVTLEHGQLLIKVLDDGPGLTTSFSSSGLGMALNNISSRLVALYGEGSEFTLDNRPDKGAIAAIKIPLQQSEI